jgi:hypothetical protein
MMLTARFIGLKKIPATAHEDVDAWMDVVRHKGIINESDEEVRTILVNPDHQFGLLSRELFESIGGYDEEHFTMWGLECQDLSLRIIQSGGYVYSGIPRVTNGKQLIVFHEFHDADREEERRDSQFEKKWGQPWSFSMLQRMIIEADIPRRGRGAPLD